MHPFQDGSITGKGKQRHKGDRQTSRDGASGAGAASAVTSGPSSGNFLRSSTRLPTYVDYTALNGKAGHANNSADLPTDADDKLKKYYSVTSGSIRGRIIARANATKGWFGAALRAGVRAGFLETRFWIKVVLLFLLIAGFTVSYLYHFLRPKRPKCIDCFATSSYYSCVPTRFT